MNVDLTYQWPHHCAVWEQARGCSWTDGQAVSRPFIAEQLAREGQKTPGRDFSGYLQLFCNLLSRVCSALHSLHGSEAVNRRIDWKHRQSRIISCHGQLSPFKHLPFPPRFVLYRYKCSKIKRKINKSIIQRKTFIVSSCKPVKTLPIYHQKFHCILKKTITLLECLPIHLKQISCIFWNKTIHPMCIAWRSQDFLVNYNISLGFKFSLNFSFKH